MPARSNNHPAAHHTNPTPAAHHTNPTPAALAMYGAGGAMYNHEQVRLYRTHADDPAGAYAAQLFGLGEDMVAAAWGPTTHAALAALAAQLYQLRPFAAAAPAGA